MLHSQTQNFIIKMPQKQSHVEEDNKIFIWQSKMTTVVIELIQQEPLKEKKKT